MELEAICLACIDWVVDEDFYIQKPLFKVVGRNERNARGQAGGYLGNSAVVLVS
jgi:hypothetical protein